MPSVVVLGSHSFCNSSVKVGLQFIAEGLARRGWQVDYLSASSSPLDLLSKTRRWRWNKSWLQRVDLRGIEIAPNLKEYILRAPFPLHKSVLRWGWQSRLYPVFLPSAFRKRVYDACISETGGTILFLPHLQARAHIWRLSDLPRGFSYATSPLVADAIEGAAAGGLFAEIWAVSQPLADYAYRLGVPKKTGVLVLPNGVDLTAFTNRGSLCEEKRLPRSAVFVGSIEEWVNVELVDRAASLMPGWQFDFYGPLRRTWAVNSPNVRYLGPVSHDSVPEVLSLYEVGLIPFKDVLGLMEAVERPLKFYEYLASGLGIASTDIGGLRRGMGDWAFYGNTPEDFAAAVEKASLSRTKMNEARIKEFLKGCSWAEIINTAERRLSSLLKI